MCSVVHDSRTVPSFALCGTTYRLIGHLDYRRPLFSERHRASHLPTTRRSGSRSCICHDYPRRNLPRWIAIETFEVEGENPACFVWCSLAMLGDAALARDVTRMQRYDVCGVSSERSRLLSTW